MRNFIHHELPKLERTTAPDGTRVYQVPSGSLYPSVTTVTGLHSRQWVKEWRARVGDEEADKISARSSSRGTRIHQYCEDYLRGNVFEVSMFDQEMFNPLRRFLDNINNIHCLETQLYSEHLQVAGTVDCIAEYRGKLSVIDFKTAKSAKRKEDIHDYFMQTSAYAVAFEERTGIPVSRLVILMAVDDGPPIEFIEKRDDWIGSFKALRLEYRNEFAL